MQTGIPYSYAKTSAARYSNYLIVLLGILTAFVGAPMFLYLIIKDCLSVSLNNRPNLVAVLMAVIIHLMPRHQSHLDCHALIFNVKYPEAPPGFLRKHHLLVNFIYKGLNVA